jgi:hypothetical protein
MATPHPRLGGEQWLGTHVDMAAPDLPRSWFQKALVEVRVSAVMARTRGDTKPPLVGGPDSTCRGPVPSHRGPNSKLE